MVTLAVSSWTGVWNYLQETNSENGKYRKPQPGLLRNIIVTVFLVCLNVNLFIYQARGV